MVFIGIDIGTSSTKAVIINRDGQILDTVSISVKLAERENRNIVWYDHFCRTLDYFKAKGYFNNKVFCSITSQGGSFVFLDKTFTPVSRVYSWTENSHESIVNDLSENIGFKEYYHITGWEPDGWLMSCKLKELSNNGQIPTAKKYIATVADYIYAQLFGEFFTDITSAQITGLCDFQNRQWDEQILHWVGIEVESLPRIIGKAEVLYEEVSTTWGKISFVTSSHDQYAAIQAAGLKINSGVLLGTGTAWVMSGKTNQPVFDDNDYLTHPGRDLDEQCYGNIITTSNISGAIGQEFDLILEQFKIGKDHLVEIEDSLLHLPVPKAKWSLRLVKEECDMYVAIKRFMEFSASQIAFIIEKHQAIKKGSRMTMSGGAASSHVWPQIISDICNVIVDTIKFSEFTAYGAALCAKSALDNVHENRDILEIMGSVTYEPINNTSYQQWYQQHQKPEFEVPS